MNKHSTIKIYIGLLAMVGSLCYLGACDSSTIVNGVGETDTDTDSDMDSDTDADTDSDTDLDTDVDSDTDTDSDTDSDTDTDTDTDADTSYPDEDSDGWVEEFDCDETDPAINPEADEIYDPPNGIDEDCDGLTDEEPVEVDTDTEQEEMIPDCSGCPAVGTSMENMRCAVDLCDDTVYQSGAYTSPSNTATDETYEALTRFGSTGNQLAPLLNDSYAIMATGIANTTEHNWGPIGDIIQDPFSNDDNTYNVMEWSLDLVAPSEAKGFRIHYVFFSAEYDEYIGSPYNDKFYIVLEANSANGGEPTVINYTECRDAAVYYDFDAAGGCDLPTGYCCYIAINTAFSECCWYPYESVWADNPGDPPCPDGFATTDISGTGFECTDNEKADTSSNGSSTGWLYTEWVIEPNEEFTLTFHIHDTGDAYYDSEVIIDKFVFVTEANPGTGEVQ